MNIIPAVIHVIQSDETKLKSTVIQAADVTVIQPDETKFKATVYPSVADEFHGGQKTVSVPGTRELLATDIDCIAVVVKGLASNTGVVYVGDIGLTLNQFELSAKEAIALGIGNLNKIYVDAVNAGEGVCYVYVV